MDGPSSVPQAVPVPKVLIVEDEENILASLQHALQREGYKVFTVADGPAALDIFSRERPDLVLLDLMLPGMPGLDVCRAIRAAAGDNQPGIIMVTAKSSDMDAVVGLESGADDYVTKPFNLGLLLARVRALLRRQRRSLAVSTATGRTEQDTIVFGNLRIDVNSYEVWWQEKQIDLSPRLFEILVYLAKNAGRVIDRDRLLNEIWGYECVVQTRTVDVHVHWLREQLSRAGCPDNMIQTVRGVGYKMVLPEACQK